MKFIKTRIFLLALLALCFQVATAQKVVIEHLSSYAAGAFDEGAAEIVAHDPITQRIFFVNASTSTIDVLNISNPANPTLIKSIDLTPYGDQANSIDVANGIVAAAVQADAVDGNGKVVFFDTDGNFLNSVDCGVLPDMLTFAFNGTKVLVANEGQPNDDYTIDPEGSVTIVDLANGVANATATQITFSAFNSRKASLQNRGIRIFGPNATVAQDLEPEYIAVSEAKNLAYVTCQENNALAVINLTTNTAIDILPLGYKDHSKGAPKLQEFFLNELPNWPSVGTPVFEGAPPVTLGGFSGLYFDAKESTADAYVLYTIPDRGPNGAAIPARTANAVNDLRTFKLPNYQGRIVKIVYNPKRGTVSFDEKDQIFLTRQDGTTPISGRGNIKGYDEVPVTFTDPTVYTQANYTVNGVSYAELPYDELGGDFEGIFRDNDGNFWMCDEYRPAIYKFAPNGTLIERFVAEGTSALGVTPQPVGTYGKETLPAVYAKRWANRGFEAIAFDAEKELVYAFIQSPIDNPNSSIRNSDVLRILAVNLDGEPVAEYVYLLERNRNAGVGISRVDKIGDAVYMGNGRFMVIERDSSVPDDGNAGKKYIFEIDLKGATNILGTALATKTTSTGATDKTLE
ncbi:MAG: esterase-like activity of phytase family protein [Saprospiraceae bacterium]|nr:esterase-like activity of phytase family protein [Saprospiraceae bacterium]